jgi:hypothetical protein
MASRYRGAKIVRPELNRTWELLDPDNPPQNAIRRKRGELAVPRTLKLTRFGTPRCCGGF